MDYQETFDWLEDHIPTRLKETRLTRHNCSIDVLDSFLDGTAVLITYGPDKWDEPLTCVYPANASLRALFDDVAELERVWGDGGAN